MRHLNKLASVFCAAALGLLALTGCEGGDLYNMDSPDWISEKIDSINNAKNSGDEEELVGMMEDVYTIGNTDFSSGWWASFSKYYVIPENTKWNAVFNLSINPSASNTYKNFALIITNDVERSGDGYLEYGAIRYDNQPSGNSEWGTYIDRSFVQSDLTFATNTDEGVSKLGGKVTLTVDRSKPDTFLVKITNGTITKTYTQLISRQTVSRLEICIICYSWLLCNFQFLDSRNYSEGCICHNWLTAILTLEGLIVDYNKCLLACCIHIRNR